MRRHPLALAAAAALILGVGLGLAACATPPDDPVVLRLATLGDSRQDPQPDVSARPLSAQDARWLQNTPAFARLLREIGEQRPQMLVFNGDMVMGYGHAVLPPSLPATPEAYMATDLARLHTQYAYWRGMVAPLMAAGTYVLPVPGNHEVQCSSRVNAGCQADDGGRHAMAANEDAWRANMADLVLDLPRLAPATGLPVAAFQPDHNPCPRGGPCSDYLRTPQQALSYSFDLGPVHIAVINTDPVGRDSHAPTGWLRSDLAAARARGAQRLFVFGHKPAYTHAYAGAPAGLRQGLDVDAPARDAFWQLIEQTGATYFCGHQHLFHAMQPRGGAWQVMVGSGGSPFDVANPAQPGLQPGERDYAWADVQVHRSGAVDIEVQGFPAEGGATRRLWGVRLPPVR